MYRENVQTRGRRKGQGAKSNRIVRSRKERVRINQLFICLVLFLTLFIGKGVFPERVGEMSGVLLAYMGQNTDFRGAFTRLGRALAEEPSVLGEIGAFCVEVFGEDRQAVQVSLPVSVESLGEEERRFLNSSSDSGVAAAHYLRLEQVPQEWFEGQEVLLEEKTAEETEVVAEKPEEVPAVGAILLKAEPQEKNPPDGHTLDHLSLGGLEVCTPVMGPLWSEYGYRDHPMDGEHKFHSGVDIGADTGTSIGAFAAGTVEYIGESDAYGNYLQIDHGQGIKSFYAHCDSLLVQQGQQVTLGETVARVGATGSATGPHLHLELKCGGVRIDPAYYIQYREP